MTLDNLLVLLIVVAAAIFVIRRMVRQAQKTDAGCGCSGDCGGCPGAPGGLSKYDPSADADCCSQRRD